MRRLTLRLTLEQFADAFVSFLDTQSTLWPLPRTGLNASDTVASIALVSSILLVVLVPLLSTLAMLHAARTRTLLAFTLVFLAAMLLTLAPVFAIYGALRPPSCGNDTPVTAYLSAGSLQLFSTRSGKQVGSYDYARPARGPSGDLDFVLQAQSSDSTQSQIRFVYDPEIRVAGLTGGYTISFPEGAFKKGEGHERFTLRADRGQGAVVLQSLGRAPTPGGRGTLKVCAAADERALVAMAVASWVYTREY